MKFLIISILNNYSLVKDLETKKIYLSKALGKMKGTQDILVGDYCDANILSEDEAQIINIYPRNNSFYRPKIANINSAFLIMSSTMPKFDHLYVDKIIFQLEQQNIKPTLLISKIDLQQDIHHYAEEYKKMGYDILKFNLKDLSLENIADIKNRVDKTTLILGKSGVGKSTLINNLVSKNEQQNISNISKKLQQGVHTTTHSKIFTIDTNKNIVDTPGFQIIKILASDYVYDYNSFTPFKKYSGKCKFNNCSHIDEPDCNIKNQVEQGTISKFFYEDYLTIIKELLNKF